MLSQKYPEMCDIISGRCHPPLVGSLIAWSMNIAQQQMQTLFPRAAFQHNTVILYTVSCVPEKLDIDRARIKKKKKVPANPLNSLPPV